MSVTPAAPGRASRDVPRAATIAVRMRRRYSSRVILLRDDGRVLLFRFAIPPRADAAAPRFPIFWAMPGGEQHAGETAAETARRELWEETGAELALGPQVWRGEYDIDWNGETVWAVEQFFLVRTAGVDVRPAALTAGERCVLGAHRWWTCDELASAREPVFPRRAGELIARLIAGDVPASPILVC